MIHEGFGEFEEVLKIWGFGRILKLCEKNEDGDEFLCQNDIGFELGVIEWRRMSKCLSLDEVLWRRRS